MKKLFTLFCCVVFCAVLSAQDIIVTAKAERIEALITEVSPTEIRYKKWSFQDGPTFVIGVSDLSAIIFKNGEVQVFNKKETAQTAQTTTQQMPTVRSTATTTTTQQTPYNPSAERAVEIDESEISSDGKRRYITDTRFQAYLYGGAIFENGSGGPTLDASFGARIRDYVYVGFQIGTHFLIGLSADYAVGAYYTPLAANLKIFIPAKQYVYPHFDCAIGGLAGAAFGRVGNQYGSGVFGGFYCSFGAGIDAKRFSAGIGYTGVGLSSGYGSLGYIRLGVRLGRM